MANIRFGTHYPGLWYGMEPSKSDIVNLKSLSKGKGLNSMAAKENYRGGFVKKYLLKIKLLSISSCIYGRITA